MIIDNEEHNFNRLCDYVKTYLTTAPITEEGVKEGVVSWLSKRVYSELEEERLQAAIRFKKTEILNSEKPWFPWKITFNIERR